MSSSSDSGSEDWRWDSSTISEIPEGYLQQEIKTSCRTIQSCKSTPQPLTGADGPGPAAARRVSFWAWNCKESRDARCRGAVPGCSCCRAFPMITTMSIKDSATMTGRLHLSLFVFSLQFIFWFIREKRVPQHSQTRTSWTRSHGLAPRHPHSQPSTLGGGGGWQMLALRRRDHQCWLVVVSNIVFFCVFSVEYSNMYNLSINELCILRGNLYICPHNCIVCVRMVISFYPATRIHVHFSHEVRSFCATAPASGAGPARWFGRS